MTRDHTSPSVTIRVAAADDVDELRLLAHRLFLGAYLDHPKMPADQLLAYAAASFAPSVVADLVADDDVLVAISEADRRMVGLVVARVEDPPPPNRLPVPSVEIWRLYVDPEVQGSGLGRRLIEWSEQAGAERGAEAVWLAVWEHNEPAQAFYDRLGFTRLGTTRFKLDDEDQCDWVLTRPIPTAPPGRSAARGGETDSRRSADTVERMKCPVCDVALSISSREGVEIDFCPQCRGVWLDRGELDKIIERNANLMAAAPAPTAPEPRDRYRETIATATTTVGDDDRDRDDDRYRKKKKRGSFLEDIFDFG